MNTSSSITPLQLQANALPSGTRLFEYVIAQVVALRDFDIVYEARDELLARTVLIREYMPCALAIRRDSAEVVADEKVHELFDKGRARFVKVARFLAQTHHPAMSEVLRFFEANGTAYIVMPKYSNTSLAEMIHAGYRIERGDKLLALLLPILDGLKQLHATGSFHLDVSSDNILMSDAGLPVLTNFDAGQFIQPDANARATLVVKPGFSPLELYGEGSDIQIGAWTDIYSVCALAYQLVTGHIPPSAVTRISRDNIKPLTTYTTPMLPAAVLHVIELGLSLVPIKRPQTIEAFVEALKDAALNKRIQLLDDAHYDSQPAANNHPGVKSAPVVQPKKNNTLKLLGGVAAAAVVGLVALWQFRSAPSDDAQSQVVAASEDKLDVENLPPPSAGISGAMQLTEEEAESVLADIGITPISVKQIAETGFQEGEAETADGISLRRRIAP